MKKILSKISNTQVLIFLTIILLIIVSITTLIPSLARFANRHTITDAEVWDGTVATKFKNGDGSSSSPFIISNGSELAYLEQTLNTMDYNGYHFKLTKDIVLNKGIFNYSVEDGITYVLDDTTYYIEEYTNEIYEDKDRTIELDQGPHVSKFNVFNSLKNFKGEFNGNNFTIKGLYISSENEEVALFTNLGGDISNLYLDNTLVYGGNITAALASKSNDNSITNVMASGNIISDNLKEITKNETLENIVVNTFENGAHALIDLEQYIPLSKSNLTSVILTGNFTQDNETETTVKINNETLNESSFSIDLTQEDLKEIYIDITSESLQTVTLKNLKLKIVSDEQIAGGLIALANNVNLKNVINKVQVNSNMYAGGLVGSSKGTLEINNSYNTGFVNSKTASGIIGVIENNNEVTINKVYNTGIMTGSVTGSFVGSTIDSTIDISNSFNTSTNEEIGEVENTTLNVVNSYTTNQTNNSFRNVNINNLNDKDFTNNTLGFNEYIDSTETLDNAWVYQIDSLPILFIDDATKKLATIYAGNYNFDNFSDMLSPIKFNDSIKFTIEVEDYYKDNTEVYYCVSDTVLTKEELEEQTFNPYLGLVNITTNGVNIIYAKLVRTVVNNEEIVSYINTDRLVISDALPSVSMKLNESVYNSLIVENLATVYIDRPTSITVNAKSLLDDYLDIKYYLTDEIKMESQIKALDDSEWNDYNNEIKIDELGTYLVYVKVTDSSGEKVFINSDFIVLDGYIAKKTQCGTNSIDYEELTISKNSSMYFRFKYENVKDNLQYKHYVKLNKPLPVGTTLTLVDNKTNKYYEHHVSDNITLINFNEFYEIGTINKDSYYQEFNYYEDDFIKEDFEILADFSTSEVDNDYEDLELSIVAKSNELVRNTIYTTMKQFTVIDEDTTSFLTTDYSGNTINLNTPITTNITLNTGINSSSNNTEFENKSMGLLLSVIDSFGEKVELSKLNNMYFKVGDEFYYPEDDNTLRIPLNKINGITNLLITSTNETLELENGEYTLLIENFISDDGKYYSKKLGDTLEFNLLVNNKENNEKLVNIEISDESKIIEKSKDTEELIFEVDNSENLDIKVSLYKKDELTAYNQDYTIIDINSVLTEELTKYADNIYNIGTINFNTNLLESTGYKIAFLIYKDDELVESINKYFIVR